MSMATFSDLKFALQKGLLAVSEIWHYKTKDWVNSVYAADIDNDGDIEVLIGSRDGRVHVVTNGGEGKWKRVVGSKKWIASVVGVVPDEGEEHYASVLVGTQDGKVYAFDRKGRTISKDRQTVFAFDQYGWAIDREQEVEAFWHNSEYEIRFLSLGCNTSSQIVIDSEDRRIYTLNNMTGETGWTFSTNGVVRAVYSCDINGDGHVETLVASSDQHLYILDDKGKILQSHNVQGLIHTIYAADVDNDGKIELLLGIDGKVLTLIANDQRVWRHPFPNRFLALAVADLDGDGENEILVGSEDRHLYILDAHGNEIWRHYLGYRVYSLYTCDIDNDGKIEVLIGAQDNKVHCCHVTLSEKLNGLLDNLSVPACFAEQQTICDPLASPISTCKKTSRYHCSGM